MATPNRTIPSNNPYSLFSKWIAHPAICIVCFTYLLSAYSLIARAENFTDAIHAYLKDNVDSEKSVGVVVGIVDEHGSNVVSYGKLDNGTDQDVNGDTLFEIGSDTKTFTTLLLADMFERGEMQLDDPVAKYLPESVKMPTHGGKQITLRHLATHTSGLPSLPDNLNPMRADNPYARFTVENLYAFVSRYALTRDPGEKSAYSNLGMGLLGHAIALKAGKDYESLIVERICGPLKMESTRITLTPELKSRFAAGHDRHGERVPNWDIPTIAGAGALRSTANDLLKYISANVGLAPSNLSAPMKTTHELGLGWFVERDRHGVVGIISHGGGTGGFRSFTGFDKKRRRGVVVLANVVRAIDVDRLGKFLLRCEWQSERRVTAENIDSSALTSYVGQYQRSPERSPTFLKLRQWFFSAPMSIVFLLAGCCVAGLAVLFSRAKSSRRRWIILGCAAPVVGVLAALIWLAPGPTVEVPSEPSIGIRREGDRLFAQTTASGNWPISVIVPPVSGELVRTSEAEFFERLSGSPLTFSRDAQGSLTGFTARTRDNVVSYEKTSDQPPEPPQRRNPPIAIDLDANLLDACVGRYEFSPNTASATGFKLRIWREGQQLIARAEGADVIQGAFEIYPESETAFFIKLNEARLTFIKDDKGEVTHVIHHETDVPDFHGKKVEGD
jgi:CubicO group peptidase (beta-lactamase class C family)